MKPNFLFIGADKCGSTWIFDYLIRHPQAFVPPSKDLYFFDRFFNRGQLWYERKFDEAQDNHLAVGEVCHDYLFSEDAAKRICDLYPDIKIVACIRQPVDRLISQFLYLRRSGLAPSEINAAVDEIPRIVDNSCYAKHLAHYFHNFPRKSIKVLRFENLSGSPSNFSRQLTTFLGISHIEPVRLGLTGRSRPATAARSLILSKALKMAADRVRAAGFEDWVGKAKSNSAISRMLYRELKDIDGRPRLSGEQRTRVLDLLQSDLCVLESLLQEDFSDWKREILM